MKMFRFLFADYMTKHNSFGNMWHITVMERIFKRIMFTFKMIGDHGQVKFIKTLKNIPEFRDKFEFIFTSQDSLALLYANVNQITNMTLTEQNFPSQFYCTSEPRGLIWYPSS